MKKELMVVVCLSLILVLSLSFVSASWFDDLFGKITGKTTSEEIEVNVTIIDDINGDGFNETVTNTGVIGFELGNMSNNIIAFPQDNILKYYDIDTDTLTNT